MLPGKPLQQNSWLDLELCGGFLWMKETIVFESKFTHNDRITTAKKLTTVNVRFLGHVTNHVKSKWVTGAAKLYFHFLNFTTTVAVSDGGLKFQQVTEVWLEFINGSNKVQITLWCLNTWQ